MKTKLKVNAYPLLVMLVIFQLHVACSPKSTFNELSKKSATADNVDKVEEPTKEIFIDRDGDDTGDGDDGGDTGDGDDGGDTGGGDEGGDTGGGDDGGDTGDGDDGGDTGDGDDGGDTGGGDEGGDTGGGDDGGDTGDDDDCVGDNCDGSNSGGGTPPPPPEDIEGNAICNPLGGSSTADASNGISAELYDGSLGQYRNVNLYFTEDQKVSDNIIFSDINVPTRAFSRGFASNAGDVLKNMAGDPLFEWFALKFNGSIKLTEEQQAGFYEFAVLSDDGSVLRVQDPFGMNEAIISHPKNTPTKMHCSDKAVFINKNEKLKFELDYFQGPKHHIAVVLLWRKVTDPITTKHPRCGESGNSLYFDSTVVPSRKQPAYKEILDAGFKPVASNNFYLPETIPYNPCINNEVEVDGTKCVIDKLNDSKANLITLSKQGVIESSIEAKIDGSIVAHQYIKDSNKVQFNYTTEERDIEISYCFE